MILEKILSLSSRIEKEMNGALTTTLILYFIGTSKKVYGYQIKKNLKLLNNLDIQSSTLYTILRKLENNHKLVESEKPDIRRFYKLTDTGKEELQSLIDIWVEHINHSSEIVERIKRSLKTQAKFGEIVS